MTFEEWWVENKPCNVSCKPWTERGRKCRSCPAEWVEEAWGAAASNTKRMQEHLDVNVDILKQVQAERDALRSRLATVNELLDDAFDPDACDSADLYSAQGVNQAHRVASGGFAPRKTAIGEVE